MRRWSRARSLGARPTLALTRSLVRNEANFLSGAVGFPSRSRRRSGNEPSHELRGDKMRASRRSHFRPKKGL
jgi:hypothetical protein